MDEVNRLSPDICASTTDEEKLYLTEAGTGESSLFKGVAAGTPAR